MPADSKVVEALGVDLETLGWGAVGVVALGAAAAGFRMGMQRPFRSKSVLAEAMRSTEGASGAAEAAAAEAEAAEAAVDGVALARRALMYGTGIALAGGAVSMAGVCWALDIRSFKEFGDRARAWAPGKRERVQDSLGLVWREYDDEEEAAELKEMFDEEVAKIEAAEAERKASGESRRLGEVVMGWWEGRGGGGGGPGGS